MLAAWAWIWKTQGDRLGFLGLINAWAFWLLLTWLPVGVMRLAGRSPLLTASWAATGLALFASRYSHALPWRQKARRDQTRGEEGRLRIASQNVLRTNHNPNGVYKTLHSLEPDVIVLQELSGAFQSYLATRLKDYPHRYWHPDPRSGGGLGVFSRLPFEVTGLQTGIRMRPYALRVTFDLKGQAVDVYNVHLLGVGPSDVEPAGLTGNFRQREEQAVRLVAEVRRRGRPALLLGDCNLTEGNDSYGILEGALTDAWREVGQGPGWTWPRTYESAGKSGKLSRPMLRLDYCFCTANVQPVDMQVLYHPIGSDHCPILVDALLPNGSDRTENRIAV
jgi:vancomycin resistance protein VanJ